MGANVSNAEQVSINNARIAGTQKNGMGQASILVESVAYTPPQIIGIYQADLDAMAEVATAVTALAEARAKAAPAAASRKTFDRGYKRAIEGAYGNSPATLADYGIVFATPAVPTAAEKAAAAAKAKATRALRHTMGKNQKAAITLDNPTGAAPTVVVPAAAASTGGAGTK